MALRLLGQYDRLPALADELVKRRVGVIFAIMQVILPLEEFLLTVLISHLQRSGLFGTHGVW
jgi:hypothetical protein